MALKLFKPNKSNKGFLLTINHVANKDIVSNGKTTNGNKCFFFNFLSQTGWDEKTQTGKFSGGNKLTVKFAPHEAAGIVDSIRRNIELNISMKCKYVFHDGDEYGTTIYFGPHFKKIKQPNGDWVDTQDQDGYYLRVVKAQKSDKDKKEICSIGFTYAESELLVQYILHGLRAIFFTLQDEDADFANNRQEEKNKTVQKPAPTTNKKLVQEKVVENDAVLEDPELTETTPKQNTVDEDDNWGT